MSAIKRFFEKRKLNVKFKKAGDGHRLDQPSAACAPANRGPAPVRSQPADPHAAQKAADAALARLSTNAKDGAVVVRARMRTEIEAEKRRQLEAEAEVGAAPSPSREVTLDAAPMVDTVLFCCPEIGPQLLPKDKMEAHITEFLYNSLAEDPELTSAVMIHTLNKSGERVRVCVETLVRYLDNILQNPGQERFLKIRLHNPAFQERVSQLQGTEEFLQAAGFVLRELAHGEGRELFWVLEGEAAGDTQRLEHLKEALLAAEPIKPQLHRALAVFHPSPRAATFHIPDDFYSVSLAEVRKEQQRREEAAEKLGQLRTKAMRERDQQRELRRYRYALIRTRFPDGLLLQAMFKAQEKLWALRQFIGEQLVDWLPFTLTTATGQRLTDQGLTLAELGLAPAAVLNFAWEPEVQAEITAQKGARPQPFLKPELMKNIQALQ